MSNNDCHAISGYVFIIGNAAFWSSKRQEIVTLSTTEAEYVAPTHAAREAIWLPVRSFLNEVWRVQDKPIEISSDNQGKIALARDDIFQARTKRIDIRFHFIRFSIEDNKIRLTYCSTADMTADCLTKALPSAKAKHFAAAMGLAKGSVAVYGLKGASIAMP